MEDLPGSRKEHFFAEEMDLLVREVKAQLWEQQDATRVEPAATK